MGFFSVPAGAAGYVDTDCSATVGTNPQRLWQVHARVIDGSTQLIGARVPGETADPSLTSAYAEFLAYCSAAGHIELYRNAAQNAGYYIIGYFE